MTGEINGIHGRSLLISKGIRAEDKFDKVSSKHDRLLSMLKHDHGYVNDKAVAELERLLRQFNSINKHTYGHHMPLRTKVKQDA